MLRKPLIAALLLTSLFSAGCRSTAGAPADSPDPVVVPAPAAPQSTDPPEQEDPPRSTVSSTVSIVDHPWITAPARISTFAKQVRLQFSAPVDRVSVETRLKERLQEYPHTFDWKSDQELILVTPQGCAHLPVGADGAKDAHGHELDAANNPVLDIHKPCHGTGYMVVSLPDGKALAGFPDGGIAVDTHPGTGRILGRNGTIYFLMEGGAVRALAHTDTPAWARFLPDGSVLLSDGSAVRLVDPDGTEKRKVELSAHVLTGALSPDGKEAVLLLRPSRANTTADVVRLNLSTWSAAPLQPVGRSVEFATLHWVPGAEMIRVMPERSADWMLNLKTGEAEDPLELQIYSPDGRWMVDGARRGIYATGSDAVIPLTDELTHPYALWAPDSQHVLLSGGQVIDIQTGQEVFSLQTLRTCADLYPRLVGSTGSGLFAAYADSCH